MANNLLVNGMLSFGSNSSKTGLTKGWIGFGKVDNASDASKHLSTAATTASANKADKDATYTKTRMFRWVSA